eukprot:TRINITY_DN335_c0_g1_i1.p1 TRINITY_DN335_c0_g1~~TRINITY_DN335_c0_g1_i1.p1  ORF type:complete len:1312 (+),score=303.67 TRINITY_DN335_c0_g1_i1:85-4020(+)
MRRRRMKGGKKQKHGKKPKKRAENESDMQKVATKNTKRTKKMCDAKTKRGGRKDRYRDLVRPEGKDDPFISLKTSLAKMKKTRKDTALNRVAPVEVEEKTLTEEEMLHEEDRRRELQEVEESKKGPAMDLVLKAPIVERRYHATGWFIDDKSGDSHSKSQKEDSGTLNYFSRSKSEGNVQPRKGMGATDIEDPQRDKVKPAMPEEAKQIPPSLKELMIHGRWVILLMFFLVVVIGILLLGALFAGTLNASSQTEFFSFHDKLFVGRYGIGIIEKPKEDDTILEVTTTQGMEAIRFSRQRGSSSGDLHESGFEFDFNGGEFRAKMLATHPHANMPQIFVDGTLEVLGQAQINGTADVIQQLQIDTGETIYAILHSLEGDFSISVDGDRIINATSDGYLSFKRGMHVGKNATVSEIMSSSRFTAEEVAIKSLNGSNSVDIHANSSDMSSQIRFQKTDKDRSILLTSTEDSLTFSFSDMDAVPMTIENPSGAFDLWCESFIAMAELTTIESQDEGASILVSSGSNIEQASIQWSIGPNEMGSQVVLYENQEEVIMSVDISMDDELVFQALSNDEYSKIEKVFFERQTVLMYHEDSVNIIVRGETNDTFISLVAADTKASRLVLKDSSHAFSIGTVEDTSFSVIFDGDIELIHFQGPSDSNSEYSMSSVANSVLFENENDMKTTIASLNLGSSFTIDGCASTENGGFSKVEWNVRELERRLDGNVNITESMFSIVVDTDGHFMWSFENFTLIQSQGVSKMEIFVPSLEMGSMSYSPSNDIFMMSFAKNFNLSSGMAFPSSNEIVSSNGMNVMDEYEYVPEGFNISNALVTENGMEVGLDLSVQDSFFVSGTTKMDSWLHVSEDITFYSNDSRIFVAENNTIGIEPGFNVKQGLTINSNMTIYNNSIIHEDINLDEKLVFVDTTLQKSAPASEGLSFEGSLEVGWSMWITGDLTAEGDVKASFSSNPGYGHTTVANGGEEMRMTQTKDGRFLFLYLATAEDLTNSLVAGYCTDVLCSEVITTTLIASSVSSGLSLAISKDGLPLFTYSTTRTYISECTDNRCSSIGWTTVLLDAKLRSVHMAIGIDGYPIIAYEQTAMKVLHCEDSKCLSTVDNELEANQGAYPNIVIGRDGLPSISYYLYMVGVVTFVHCEDIACSIKTPTEVDGTGNVGAYLTMRLGNDGFMVMAYKDSTNNNLKLIHCQSLDCDDLLVHRFVVDPGTGNVGDHIGIAIGRDGYPIISYQDGKNQDLKFARCRNEICSSATYATIAQSDNDIGLFSRVEVGQDGMPAIGYYDNTGKYIKFIHCANYYCIPYLRA